MSQEPEPPTASSDATPALSVVLITPDSFETIRRTVKCLTRQTVRERIELVIVAPEAARIDVDDDLVAPLAGVRIVPMASLTPTGPGRAAGIRAASAPVVAFGEEHCFPSTTWAEALLAAHREEVAAVGPAMHNANPDSIVSWADFLIGYGPWAAPIVRQDTEFLPGHNSSYKRAVLIEYGTALETLMEAETVLMWDLRGKGHRLLLEPAAHTAHTNFVSTDARSPTRARRSGRSSAAWRSLPPRRPFRSLGSRARSVTRDGSDAGRRSSPASSRR